MAVILVTRLWIFPEAACAGVRGAERIMAPTAEDREKKNSQKNKTNLGIKSGSESKSDNQPQSIQFLLSSKSPVWQITQQSNVDLLINNTQTSQVSCRTSLHLGHVICLSWGFIHCFHLPRNSQWIIIQFNWTMVLCLFALTSVAMDSAKALRKSKLPLWPDFWSFCSVEFSQRNEPLRQQQQLALPFL